MGVRTMGTVVTGLILAAIVAYSIRNMIRDKKSGKSLSCGCDCKHCGGHCGIGSGVQD